jgi:hypothetical protein
MAQDIGGFPRGIHPFGVVPSTRLRPAGLRLAGGHLRRSPGFDPAGIYDAGFRLVE